MEDIRGKALGATLFDGDLLPPEFWVDETTDRVQRILNGDFVGFETGLKSIDRMVRLGPGDLVVVAARPSMGKTSFAMQIATKVAEDAKNGVRGLPAGGVVAVFSAEMPGWALYSRMACARAKVSMSAVFQGTATPEEGEKIKRALRELKEIPLWVDDGASPTPESMLEKVEVLTEQYPVRLIVFDFLELASVKEAGRQSEEQRVSMIATHLKAIAKRLRIPVLVVSQLSRAVDSRSSKMPALSDLRYSGMIEQLADVVLMMMRPAYYYQKGQEIKLPDDASVEGMDIEKFAGLTYMSVAKNRNGPTGMVKLFFDPAMSIFADLYEGEEEGRG